MTKEMPVSEKSIAGAIIGDIAGSRFEFRNHRSKVFKLLSRDSFVTDDSVMTLAVAKALLDADGDVEKLKRIIVPTMQCVGRPYRHCGYGGHFYIWMYSNKPLPYNSFGNGAAMRVSSVAYAAQTIDEVKKLSHIVTAVSHNHPEGLKGAEAAAVATFMALTGSSKEEIRAAMEKDYYRVSFTIDKIRLVYEYHVSCQGTLPVALAAFYESTGFEDAIRNAVSIGGDSDTIAAITGAIAGAYYGVPEDISSRALKYLDERLLDIYTKFSERYKMREIPRS